MIEAWHLRQMKMINIMIMKCHKIWARDKNIALVVSHAAKKNISRIVKHQLPCKRTKETRLSEIKLKHSKSVLEYRMLHYPSSLLQGDINFTCLRTDLFYSAICKSCKL